MSMAASLAARAGRAGLTWRASALAAPSAATSGRLALVGARALVASGSGSVRALHDVSGMDPHASLDTFLHRHLGPRESHFAPMLAECGFDSFDALVASTVPAAIRHDGINTGDPVAEADALERLKGIASKNVQMRNYLGMGYYGTKTPAVILRNILENPGWYTSYTPYQAEISQGRLEALLNYQTVVADLTGLAVSNASLLDEATAAAEAMGLAYNSHQGKRSRFFVDAKLHPQSIGVLTTRAEALDIELVVGDANGADFTGNDFCGVIVQYPDTEGVVTDWEAVAARAREAKTVVVAATDLLSLCLLKPPGEWGADVAVGSAQRFGVPMGFGGPHAGFFAANDKYMRKMPGRVIGISRDSRGKPALRMAMQAREQHIRRDKATSNICTAQALLANIAGAYATYHGPSGLRDIAGRVKRLADMLAAGLAGVDGVSVDASAPRFDTVTAGVKDADAVLAAAAAKGINLRKLDGGRVSVSLDETCNVGDVADVLASFGSGATSDADMAALADKTAGMGLPATFDRTSEFLTHAVFNAHRSETQMLRYLHKLQARDLSLTTSMISLGSCTMKLNATSEMIPITWPELANMHPFQPPSQTAGYQEMIEGLHEALCDITGFAAMSTQPNSGAQGEYAGLMVIREFHKAAGNGHRKVCLIPVSAHGTNPASAVMAGMKVVTVGSTPEGNVDMDDLVAKADKHADNLGALMITYPSTYGVFEEGIKDIIEVVHSRGGQVYMDGANMNAQVGITSPGHIGADVCHLNLHKTFCIPHGGGGPGVGTIGVAEHLAPFLPGHAVIPAGGEGAAVVPKSTGAVSAAQYGSALILPISWMYITMLGASGLTRATEVAILNANYMAARLKKHYPIRFTGRNGQCAHEFIIDLRHFKDMPGHIVEEDVAKRLIDYGFHAPTMSWPVPGTLMVEPTESEDKAELDRFVDALIAIRHEIEDVVTGKVDPESNPLKGAPHTADTVVDDAWDRAYSRKLAAYPAAWVREHKFWPSVGRIDNVWGDRHLVCSCPPLSLYEDSEDDE